MKKAIAHLTPDAITQAFSGTNFGRTDFDVILAYTVLKRAAGYHSGGTATAIATRLGLLSSKTERPTKAGYEWALEVFYSRRQRRTGSIPEVGNDCAALREALNAMLNDLNASIRREQAEREKNAKLLARIDKLLANSE
ncbi:hypothetical protein AU510_04455 [Lonsdalea britannica]|uniref:hypothetical protein n=1 Tax=Lonsdalea britannica TaxID=1082704 RepID=UPI000A1EC798|nr:hypothetical protein [Lonsdalea britannica]OSN08383.1 hypothetical protein AU510_04455 [Lonsdalea britannica]